MLSTMREKTKVVMIVLAVAFVGWLVFDVGMGVSGRNNTQSQDVGSVNGSPIRYQTYMDAYRSMYEQAREQQPGVNFSREDVREIENQAFNQLVQANLLADEYHRRGIVVTDREIIDAVRRLPPPEVTQSPEFQTEGRFDPSKYERFLSSSNANTRQYLLAMEARYRDELPRYKLLQEVTSDIFVSDAKLWTIWRDTHDTATVRILVIRPENFPDSARTVSDDDVRAYYEAHKAEFRRPARAALSFVAISKKPGTADSVMIVQRIRALRDSLMHGTDFAEAARNQSTDSVSARDGGSLGTFGRGIMDPTFERAAFTLPIGQVSEPVFTQFGIHLIKVEKRTADSVTARHILFPYARVGARLDTLEAQADSLDRLAADQVDHPAALDSAAHHMSLSIEKGPLLYQGTPYVLGRFRIPDVGVWAFEARPGDTSPVVEVSGGYYVFRLDSVWVAGTPPLAEVMDEARVAATRDKRKTVAHTVAQRADSLVTAGRTLDQAAQAVGLNTTTLTFTRTSSVPVLGTASAAIGQAFRLRSGERSALLSNDQAWFILQTVRRVNADSSAWVAQKDTQRATVIRSARQLRVQMFMEALRRSAKVKDRRAEVMRPTARDQAGS